MEDKQRRKMTCFSFPEIFRFHVTFLRSKDTAPMVLSISMDGPSRNSFEKKSRPEKVGVFFLFTNWCEKDGWAAIKDNQLGFKIYTPGNSHSYHLKSRPF